MPEWLKSILTAVGGGTVVLVGVLTVFKGLLVKLFESGIESSFEKSFAKFKNKLERSTRAYEILLDREMRFYEKLEPINAELVPLEHDLRYYLEHHEGIERETEYTDFRDHFERYIILIKNLKNEILIHQSYIPQDIVVAYSNVVNKMQDDAPWWASMAKLLFTDEYDKIDYKKCDELVDTLLMHLSVAETLVRKRLIQLRGED